MATGSPELFAEDNPPPEIQTVTCCLPYTAMEGAYSRGSGGFSIGTGIDNISPPSNSGEKGEPLARYYFNKGVVWPINVGLAAGTSSGGKYQELGGHLQVAIFESFAVPTFALRTFANWGFENSQLQGKAAGGSLVAQHALFSFLSFYGSVGKEKWFLETSDEIDTKASETETAWQTGAEITIVPPFVQLTVEYRTVSRNPGIFAVKTSIAM